MRCARILSGIALCLISAWPVHADSITAPYEATIALPEVEVRSGPSSDAKIYATSKLRLGEKVQVLREEKGWLAIKPPAGSFSWINTRFLELSSQKTTAVVLGNDVPVRIGSGLSDQPPTVQQVKLQRGDQVVILDMRKSYAEDGSWLPILPPPQEVRYLIPDAVRVTPQVQTVQSPPAANPLTAEAAPASNEDPMWQQATQAESAGKAAEAADLYLQLAHKTNDHGLAMRCYNRVHFLRAGMGTSAPLGYQAGRPSTASYQVPNNDGRFIPTPNYAPSAYPQPIQPIAPYTAAPATGQVTSQYTYLKDQPRPAVGQAPATGFAPPVAPAAPAPTASMPPAMASGPGLLRRAPFWLDQKAAYVLESSQGLPMMYVTAQSGLNLEAYVNRNVDLWGSVVYRGDVKKNYMVVQQVHPLP